MYTKNKIAQRKNVYKCYIHVVDRVYINYIVVPSQFITKINTYIKRIDKIKQ